MAASKYLALISGKLKEVFSVDASAGGGDAGKIVALDAGGKLDPSLFPTGIGPETVSIEASESLDAGDFVNIHDSTGPKVRKADATNNAKPAHGFVLDSVESSEQAEVYLEGQNNQLTTLTPGAVYYLSTTPGEATATPPAANGNLVQQLGTAISATVLDFEPDGLQVEVVAA